MNNSEILYLIARLLESLGCVDGAEAVKRFLDRGVIDHRNSPSGRNVEDTFENLDSLYGDVNADSLVYICKEYFNFASANRSACLRSLSSLLVLLSSQRAEKASRNPDIAQFFATLGLARGSSKCFLRNNSPGFTNRLCQSSYYKTTLRQHVLAHRSAIYCLKYDRRSEYLISASDDYTIKIWALQSSDGNLCTPFLRHTLRGHLAEIIEVDVSIDNHLLVSVDADCALVIWCLRSGQPLVSFRGSRRNRVVSGLSFIPILSPPPPPSGSPAERSGWLLVSSYGCGLHFIRYTHTLVGEEERLRRGEDTFITTCCSLKLHPTITFPTNESDSGPRNNSFAVVLDVSPGGHYVALGCSDHVVRLFTFSEDGQPTSAGTLLAHEDSVNSVSFSNSGLQLATGSADAGSCWLWNLKAGSWVGTELKLRKRPKSRPCILRWSRNDTYLIVCLKSGSVHVFDGKTGEFVSVLTGHEGAVFAVATSPLSDEILATGGADGRFYIWRLEERSSSVVFFYRYPAPQVTTDLGITWLQSTSLEVPLPQATGAGPAVDDDDERRRLRSAFSVESGVQTQRITCCIASPGADGPGFFVATKAGVISLFAPNLDIDAKPRLVNDGPPPYEEQFLHWEMDNAAAREVRTPSSAAQSSAGSVALTLGSPAASQSFGLRPPTPPQPDQQQSSSSQVFFQPPEGVLFQLVHEPSGVPFSRLPPGYLTSLRSCAYPPGRQRAQVPGRHSNSLLDAQPTLTLDDNGEEVVVDDIQFCADVPPSYTYPLPVRTAKAPIPGKHYFWRCHWLSGEADLIRPLSSLDLELACGELAFQRDFEKEHSCESDHPSSGPQSHEVNELDDTIILPVGVEMEMVEAETSTLQLPTDLTLDADVGEVPEGGDDSETDSDWSAHMDVEIGWWSSRHRRQRSANRTRSRRTHAVAASEQSTSSTRQENDEERTGDRVLRSNVGASIRRSARQRRRRERQNQLSFVTQIEAMRTLRRARRSERLRRFLRQQGQGEEPSTPTTTGPEESNNADDDLETRLSIIEEAGVPSTPPPSNTREQIKQQLICSIDYVASHRVTLPLLHPPPNGFHGTSGQTEASNVSTGPEVLPWSGPYIDWLSITQPRASPYVPQLGDRLVYIARGHKEYLSRAWQDGSVPDIDEVNAEGGQLSSRRLPLPWEVNPGLPGYLCCRVSEMAVHFMRITNESSSRRVHTGASSSSTRRHRQAPATVTGRLRRSPIRAPPLQTEDSGDTTADSFVRLVSLRLAVDDDQPYTSLGGVGSQESSTPREVFVRYHDVDGVLDFLILRSVFDEAITRNWIAGDVFICPVDDIWWRGRVLQDSSSLSDSTSSAFDPWLSVRVRWLENWETGSTDEPLLPSSFSGDLVETVEEWDRARTDANVVTYSDRLSPWDMHPWDARLPISDGPTSTLSASYMHSAEVRIPVHRLTRLFGSRGAQSLVASNPGPSTSTAQPPTFGDVIEQMKVVLDKLMSLNAASAFNWPVDLAAFPNYIVVNPHLVDLLFIRHRLENLFYRQSDAILFDIEQIYANAVRYNEPQSLIVHQAQLITSLALQAMSSPSLTWEKLLEYYIAAVRLNPQLDPTIDVSQNSSSSTVPAMEDLEVGLGSDSPRSPTLKRLRPLDLPISVSSPKRDSLVDVEPRRSGESYCLRSLALPPPLQPPVSDDDDNDNADDSLNWRKVCEKLLDELLRHRRSLFFREPVNVDQYTNYAEIIENPMDLASVQSRLRPHPRQANANLYTSPRQFLQDLELIVSNSLLFNSNVDAQVYSDTRWLSRWITKVATRRLALFLGNESPPAGPSTQPSVGADVRRRRMRRLRHPSRAPSSYVPRFSRSLRSSSEAVRSRPAEPHGWEHGARRTSGGEAPQPGRRTLRAQASGLVVSSGDSAATLPNYATSALPTRTSSLASRRPRRKRILRLSAREGQRNAGAVGGPRRSTRRRSHHQQTTSRPRRSAASAVRHYFENEMVNESDQDEENEEQYSS